MSKDSRRLPKRAFVGDQTDGSAGSLVEEQETKLEVVEDETPAKQRGPCHACWDIDSQTHQTRWSPWSPG